MLLRPAPARRGGIATIELVMVWPLLLMLVAGVFLIARAGVSKGAAATRARTAAWGNRSVDWAASKNPPPGEVYLSDHDPLESRLHGRARVPFAAGTLFPEAALEAESFTHLIDRVWDYRDQPFIRIMPMRVHESPFKLIAKNLPGGRGNLSITVVLAVAMAYDNPVYVALALAGKVLNPVVRLAGITLKVIGGTVVAPARVTVAGLRAAAQAAFQFRYAARLGRALGVLDTLLSAFDNLDRASRGLPVADPSGLSNLRLP